MSLRILLLAFAVLALRGQTARVDDVSVRRPERELTSRLQWEILWKQSPTGFRNAADGSARLAVCLTAHSLLYCSHDLGACAQYRMVDHHLGDRANSAVCAGHSRPCNEGQNDYESLAAFARPNNVESAIPSNPQQPYALGGTIVGMPKEASGLTWTMTVSLGTRADIIKRYQRSRPKELDSLRDWLRSRLQGAGYKSITIPCFASSDPEVYVYGDRPLKGPIVISIIWDRELEQWEEAGLLERPEDRRQVEELRAAIQSIACATVTFE